MAYSPVPQPVSTVRYALTSTEKLAQQRRAAAAVRAQAQAFQIKVSLAVGCALAVPLGIGIYQGLGSGGAASSPPQAQVSFRAVPGRDVKAAAVQIPDHGDQCRHYSFDNRTGAISGESKAACPTIDIRPGLGASGTPHAQAVINAFRFK